MNWGGHRHLALLSPSAEERYLVSLQSSFNRWFYPPNSSSSYQTLRTLTSTTRLFHNKTAVKRIELLGGWVLPHGRKRIFTIIRLPWKLEWCQGEDTRGPRAAAKGWDRLDHNNNQHGGVLFFFAWVEDISDLGWELYRQSQGGLQQPPHQKDQEVLWQISKSIENKNLITYYPDFGQLGA